MINNCVFDSFGRLTVEERLAQQQQQQEQQEQQQQAIMYATLKRVVCYFEERSVVL